MQAQIQDQKDNLINMLQEKKLKIEKIAKRLRKKNTLYITLSIIASTLATLLAGLTAMNGPLAGSGPPAWKITCGAVAGLTAFAGITTGLHQRLSIPERLSKCYSCAGRLNALELALTVFNREPSELAQEYQDITSTYSELFLDD
jgi:hypothetical protein